MWGTFFYSILAQFISHFSVTCQHFLQWNTISLVSILENKPINKPQWMMGIKFSAIPLYLIPNTRLHLYPWYFQPLRLAREVCQNPACLSFMTRNQVAVPTTHSRREAVFYSGKACGFLSHLLGFQSWSCQLFTMWPWASFLNLTVFFFICKTERNSVYLIEGIIKVSYFRYFLKYSERSVCFTMFTVTGELPKGSSNSKAIYLILDNFYQSQNHSLSLVFAHFVDNIYNFPSCLDSKLQNDLRQKFLVEYFLIGPMCFCSAVHRRDACAKFGGWKWRSSHFQLIYVVGDLLTRINGLYPPLDPTLTSLTPGPSVCV